MTEIIEIKLISKSKRWSFSDEVREQAVVMDNFSHELILISRQLYSALLLLYHDLLRFYSQNNGLNISKI
jgi:hypothetical protein